MRKYCKGSLTVFLALLMVFFLSFCMVLLEGARNYYFSVKEQQAMELAEFSVLSEYQQELFGQYGVFFVDLDYEQGAEHKEILEKRVEDYLYENAMQLKTEEMQIENYRRATDEGGISFFKQAVEKVKVERGYKVFEGILEKFQEESKIEEVLELNQSKAERILAESMDEEGEPLFHISLPNVSFPSIEVLTETILGDVEDLSSKKISIENRLKQRLLEKGAGEKETMTGTEMQLFHQYLFKRFSFYGSKNESVWKESLEYQLEYIISGKAEDLRNLENIMWRIFLMRAGGNYALYHQDPEKLADAEAEALIIAGVSGNGALVKTVRELILISKAIEATIEETKNIFAGEKVPLYQAGVFAGISIGYEEYLYLFLNMTKASDKIYRCMDVAEMEIRKHSGYEAFRMDHCTDSFEVTWRYRLESLFVEIPLLDRKGYEKTVKRKFYYER